MAARMLSTAESSSTIVEEVDSVRNESPTPTLRLKCKKPKSNKCVKWNADTIDNENMNKKKSKCCCIYKKPKQRFDESSDSELEDCEDCFGHVEVKNQKKIEKTSCNDESAASTSKDVTLDHVQPITSSSITAVSS